MNRRKRTLAIATILLALLIGLPCWLVYRQIEQARKDQALIAAIKAENTNRALELLSEGADGNARDMGGIPSMEQVLDRFLDRLRHHGSSSVDDEHLTALLLLYHQYYLYNTNSHNEWPESGPDLTLIRALLDRHARVNDRDDSGVTPLERASCYSNVGAVSLLLERGANIDEPDNKGMTPLMIGATVGVTRVLLEHGARTEAKDKEGVTALMYAAKDGNTEAVRLLLEHGANSATVNNDHETPLLCAVISEKPKLVRILLEHGANTEARDLHTWTPLMWATWYGNSGMVRMLLEHKAKVSPKDKYGRNASDLIRYQRSPEASKIIEALLRQYGAK